MKLLENAQFESLSATLAVETGDSRISGRLESYSCKMAGSDKRLYKALSNEGHTPGELQALSPPQSTIPLNNISPTNQPTGRQRTFSTDSQEEGSLCDTCSFKTLFYLISTLNASFHPDYDFSNSKSHEFSREPNLQSVVDSVNSQLSAMMGEIYHTLQQKLWTAIDEEIKLMECDIYSYNPDLDSDPYGEEGNLWSFNYFFYNKKMKRIVFLSCQAASNTAPMGESDDELEFEMDAVDGDMDESEYYATPIVFCS